MLSRLGTARSLLSKAQRYAQQNPDKVRRYTDKAANFADKQTKGRYREQIDKAVRKTDDLTGQRPRGGQWGKPYPGQQPRGPHPGNQQPRRDDPRDRY
ncbi:MAG: antitoxin [Pseudonocardiaceae bacterium]|nr:antitoxin [Pseudonocardiaceae bacterium]